MGVSGSDNIPIKAFFPEQEVARRATDKVGLLLLFAEVASCVLQKMEGVDIYIKLRVPALSNEV